MGFVERHRDRALGAIMAGMVLAASIVGAYAAHVPMPESALELPGENKAAMVRIFPQGWKFFTRDPRKAEPTPLHKVGDQWVPYGTRNDGSRFFGASRESRTLWTELDWVLSSVTEADWQACNGPIEACLADAPVREQRALVDHPQMCGTVAVVLRKPVPWAWAKRTPAVTMPSKVLRLEIQC